MLTGTLLVLLAPHTVLLDTAPAAATCPAVSVRADGSFDPPSALPRGDGRFEWPVGDPDGAGWYDYQPFGTNRHLGADLNAERGTRVGDPVRVIADGCVVFARDIRRGWGNVVRVIHALPDGRQVESLYAHLDRMDVVEGQKLARGALLGTVGTAHGVYGPHLHLELRDTVGRPQGHGYGTAPGYVDPMAWIEGHR